MRLDMIHGSMWSKILVFAVPFALTAFLQQLFNTADTLFLGQCVGKEAMAAVGNNVPFVNMMIHLFNGLALGSNVLIAQRLGARAMGDARRAVHSAIPLAFIMGLAVLALSQILVGPVMASLDVPDEVRDMAELYLRVFLLGIPFICLYNFESAIYRSTGDTATPLAALVAGSVLNVLLNVLLVDDYGVAGVAGATVASIGLCAAILFVGLLRHKGEIRVRPRHFCIDRRSISFIARVGAPAGVQSMVFSFSNLIIQSAINSLGADCMAGSAAAFTIEINMFCLVVAFAQAATTFVGQNYGARRLGRCRRATWICLGEATLLLGLLVLGARVFDRELLGLFNADGAVIAFGCTRLLYNVTPYFLNGVQEILSGSLRGYGISLPPALITLVGVCGVRIAWTTAVFPRDPSFETLLTCYWLSWAVTSGVLAAFYALAMSRLRRRHEKA